MVYQSSSRSLLTFNRPIMPRSYQTRFCLQAVPLEIVCLILEKLEMHDLLNCIGVSKYLRRAVRESSKLQYIIELGKHRMVSLLEPSSAPSHATRLNLLRDRERGWKYMDFKRRHSLKLPPTGSVYEFVGGFYGNGREDETRATASISFLELPSFDSSLLGNPQHELEVWTHIMDDVTIIDFTMDPSQDLLVLVALAPAGSKEVYELHLRSMKTDQPHPKAPVPVLRCTAIPTIPPQPSEIVAAVRVQVFGDLVALLVKEVFENTGAHLEIWNWEGSSGYSASMSRMSGIDDFTFLSRDSFLLVRPSGRFEVYRFSDPVNYPTAPVLRFSYMFPPLSEGYIYWYISMSSNPAPGSVPRAHSTSTHDQAASTNSPNRQVYFPHPDERIHACCLYIFNPVYEENPIVHSFVFFINLKTLSNPPPEWLTPHQASVKRNSKSRVPPSRSTVPDMAQGYESASSSSSSSSDSGFSAMESTHTLASQAASNAATIGGNSLTPSSHPTYPPFPTFDPVPNTSFAQQGPESNLFNSIASHNPPPPGVSASILGNFAPITPPSQRKTHECAPIVPWEVWGPSNTRWFQECLSTDWQHAIYGLRTVECVRVEEHPDPRKRVTPTQPPASSSSSSMNDTQTHDNQPPSSSQESSSSYDEDEDEDVEEPYEWPYTPQRYLRVRNFNDYAFKDEDLMLEDAGHFSIDKAGKGKNKDLNSDPSPPTLWSRPRLVTTPSSTPVKGVFEHDIVSCLPYIETISEGTFGVTDVMMDDCRLLLLKRGKSGKLKNVEVLMT